MSRPYYEHDDIRIFHGDCRELMLSVGSADLLVTDPPYGIGEARGRNKSRSVLAVSKDYGDAHWDDAPPTEWMFLLMREITRYQIIWGGNYFGLPKSSCWLVWDKDNGENDFADCELAWTNLPKAVRKIRWKWHGMLQENMDDKEVRVPSDTEARSGDEVGD